jgi:hypothetical protein
MWVIYVRMLYRGCEMIEDFDDEDRDTRDELARYDALQRWLDEVTQ